MRPPNKRPACYSCGSVEHKRASCPLENRTINSVRPNYSVCSACGAYHSFNGPCYGHGQSGVYATARCERDDRVAKNEYVDQSPFLLHVCINGYNAEAVRDTGNMTHTIVSPRLVYDSDYTGAYMACRGAFGEVCHDVTMHLFWVAGMKFPS